METARMDQASAGQQPAPCCCHAEHLTDREVDVLCQLAAGLTNDEAATAMNVSGHTIAGHLRTMLTRSSARNRAELIARAYAAGVLTPIHLASAPVWPALPDPAGNHQHRSPPGVTCGVPKQA